MSKKLSHPDGGSTRECVGRREHWLIPRVRLRILEDNSIHVPLIAIDGRTLSQEAYQGGGISALMRLLTVREFISFINKRWTNLDINVTNGEVSASIVDVHQGVSHADI